MTITANMKGRNIKGERTHLKMTDTGVLGFGYRKICHHMVHEVLCATMSQGYQLCTRRGANLHTAFSSFLLKATLCKDDPFISLNAFQSALENGSQQMQ